MEPKAIDMCKALGTAFFLSPIERFLLLGRHGLIPGFLEDLSEDVIGVVEADGLDCRGVVTFGDFITGDCGFFLRTAVLCSLLASLTWTRQRKRTGSMIKASIIKILQ